MSRSDRTCGAATPLSRPGSRGGGLALRLLRARSGAVVVEAALLMPLIAIAFVCSLDVARYLELGARADRIAGGVADLVSRADVIRDRTVMDAGTRSTDLGVYFALSREMALPEDLGAGGGVVISSVTGTAGAPAVNWMRSWGSGAAASAARLQALPPLPEGMSFVVAEIMLPFDPLILDRDDLVGNIGFARVIYRRAIYRPRTAALTTLAPAGS